MVICTRRESFACFVGNTWLLLLKSLSVKSTVALRPMVSKLAIQQWKIEAFQAH